MQSFFSDLMRLIRVPVAAMTLFFLNVACTSDKAQPPISAGTEFRGQNSPLIAVKASRCGPEIVDLFENEREPLDIERDSLPRGVYLAQVAYLLIEKKGEARVLVREGAGGQAEVACAEGIEKLGVDFEFTLAGLVKFEVDERATGSGLVARQFYFFQDKNGYGAIVSNPHVIAGSSPMSAPGELEMKRILRQASRLVRISEKSYVLTYQRERDGVRARLLIQLELIAGVSSAKSN